MLPHVPQFDTERGSSSDHAKLVAADAHRADVPVDLYAWLFEVDTKSANLS